jgi:hypothetical protein|tara:strand:- start:1448 stop:1981 length:534 start_codon:yes stop_codon:yes gene_type:complete
VLSLSTFFTGAPGSKWSGIAQQIEAMDSNWDISDRTPEREYSHGEYSGHKGVYFGTGMEFPATLDTDNLNAPYKEKSNKPRLHKSHEWAYVLDDIKEKFPSSNIILVYRSNDLCFEWWKQAGGWDITYPNYDIYENDTVMQSMIKAQNYCILKFAYENNLKWNHTNTDTLMTEYKGA